MSELLPLARELKHTKESLKEMKESLKNLQEEHDLQEEVLHATMKDEEVQKLTIAGKTLYLTERYFASLPDKEAGFKWLREEGLGSLIKETVHAGTLATAMKERLGNDDEVPSDIVTVTIKPKIGMRKV